MVKLDVDAGGFLRREVYEAARVVSCFCLETGLYPKEERKRQKKQWDKDHKRISVARDVHESWKNINIKCVCVYSSDTAFAQHLFSSDLRRRARIPSVLPAHR